MTIILQAIWATIKEQFGVLALFLVIQFNLLNAYHLVEKYTDSEILKAFITSVEVNIVFAFVLVFTFYFIARLREL